MWFWVVQSQMNGSKYISSHLALECIQMEIGQCVSCEVHPQEFILLWLLLFVLHFNMTLVACEWVHFPLHRELQLRRRSSSVAQETFANTLLKERGHMRPRPPLDLVWAIGSQCILNASWVHSLYWKLSTCDRHILMPGVNGAKMKRWGESVQACTWVS